MPTDILATGREASDGVHSVAVGYGTMSADRMSWNEGSSRLNAAHDTSASPRSHNGNGNSKLVVEPTTPTEEFRGRSFSTPKQRQPSVSTVASLPKSVSPSPPKKRHTARSGSISENIVEANGVRKIVLETNSSSDSEDKVLLSHTSSAQELKENEQMTTDTEGTHNESQGGGNSKKNRKKRGKKKKKGNASGSGENQPLLGGGS